LLGVIPQKSIDNVPLKIEANAPIVLDYCQCKLCTCSCKCHEILPAERYPPLEMIPEVNKENSTLKR